MSDTADASLVFAVLSPDDALHARALGHLSRSPDLTVPLTVSIEILHGAHRRGLGLVPLLMRMDREFQIEAKTLLLVAAQAVDEGRVNGVFDALHAADAVARGGRLHTADERLLRSGFPTVPF